MSDRDPFVGDPWETDDHNDGEDDDGGWTACRSICRCENMR